MAFQDWAVLAFHVFMWLRVTAAPDSADASFARRAAGLLLTVTLCTIVLVRGEILPEGRVRALLYRLGIFTPMVTSYFVLKTLLPALRPVLVDGQLLALDKALLGATPSVWMAHFNSPPVVEWFSFFYYSYFYLLAVMILPTLLLAREERPMAEMLIGTMAVCMVGHIGYTFVPGLGPHAALAFDEPLHGGTFWGLIEVTVHSAGAQMDIFPSLHTAYPTYFTLYAISQRHRAPFKYVWPIVAFFAVNMVIATMFLRWHWFVDVMAGLALAFGAWRLGITVARREAGRGLDGDDRQRVWERYLPLRGRSLSG